jgi:hypothetical protein
MIGAPESDRKFDSSHASQEKIATGVIKSLLPVGKVLPPPLSPPNKTQIFAFKNCKGNLYIVTGIPILFKVKVSSKCQG